MVPEKLGKLLLQARLITEEQLTQALSVQKKQGGRLGSILVRLGFVEENRLLDFLSVQYGIPSIDLAKVQIDPAVIKLIPQEVVQKYRVIPVKRVGSTLSLAMEDPTDVFAVDDIKFITGYDVVPLVASESGIGAAMSKYYVAVAVEQKMLSVLEEVGIDETIETTALTEQAGPTTEELKEAAEDAPVVKLVNFILSEAVKKGASDIHLEPYEGAFRVRYRLDGVLYKAVDIPLHLMGVVTSRLKIMAQLDIAEKRLTQDGRIKIQIADKQVDIRVSVLPTLFGEKIVMRLLDKSSLTLDLTKLGFEQKALDIFMKAVKSPSGMILVTGPTGSGKSTTLYSAMHFINSPDLNIMTVEDPVEYSLSGINQIQVREEIGLTFATALRSLLRQNPDAIMVGEIRDYETAEIAIKAALTGHLVFSTIHTNDAPSTIHRLLNIGVEPFLIASSVIMILAQRLVRKVCMKCREVEKVPPSALVEMGFSPKEAEGIACYKGKGCEACSNAGYKGRIALYEVMPVGRELRELILQGASADDIRKRAVSLGMKTLRMAGLQKIKEGMTSIEEVVGITFKQ